jgi:hypothetical protein
MSSLADPIYCVSCKKQIQTDAGFCPYCGFNQARPQDQEMPPVPPVMPPTGTGQQQAQYVPEPQSPTQQATQPTQVVYVQNQTKTNWWPLAIILTLLSPAGCLVVPLLLGVVVIGVSVFMKIIPMCIGFIVAVAILRKQLFPPQYRMWIFYGLIIANILWFMIADKVVK